MDGVLKPYQAGEQRGSSYKQNKMKNSRNNVATYASGLMNPLALRSSFYYHQQNQLPPLLPLPSVSLSPSTTVKSRKNRTRKSKQMQEEEAYKKKPTAGLLTSPGVCTSSFRSTAIGGNGFGFGTENVDFASWVFDLSPPPSSLPVPKFYLKFVQVDVAYRLLESSE
ncbi:hypothetical protein JHK84_041192 [Glycine max]|nr:hypothetical protein JHK85_041593 [Glycine max]KAG5122852.1 hypothetical protein JHK84_041192 [Glycine max]